MIFADVAHRAFIGASAVCPTGRWVDVGAVRDSIFDMWLTEADRSRRVRIDPDYSRSRNPDVQATGAALPLRARAAQSVTAIDVLEHVPAEQRPRIVGELLRVARQRVVLVFPYACDENVELERRICDTVRAHGESMPGLESHSKHGLPALDEISSMVAEPEFEVSISFTTSRRRFAELIEQQLAVTEQSARSKLAHDRSRLLNAEHPMSAELAYRAVVTVDRVQ